MKKNTIEVSKELVKRYQEILDIKEGYYPDAGETEVLVTLRTDFGKGIEADIKICNGDTPYIDAVLFDNGNQVCVLEPSDKIVGKYIFEYDGEKYTVIVKKQTKKAWE